MPFPDSKQALVVMSSHTSTIRVGNSHYTRYEIYVLCALLHYVKDQNGQSLSDDDIHEVLLFMRDTFATQDCRSLLKKLRIPGDKLTRSVRTVMEKEVEVWTVLAKEQYYGYMVRHQGIINQ